MNSSPLSRTVRLAHSIRVNTNDFAGRIDSTGGRAPGDPAWAITARHVYDVKLKDWAAPLLPKHKES